MNPTLLIDATNWPWIKRWLKRKDNIFIELAISFASNLIARVIIYGGIILALKSFLIWTKGLAS